MANLTGSTISSTYNLLLTTESAVMGSGLQSIQSGTGVSSALKLSTTTVSVDGSLGVGLDSPEYVIHAQAADDYVGKFESTDAGASIILEDNGSTTDGNRITVTSDALSVATANVTALTVDSSQNVGIGATPTSSYKLLVDGDICASGGHLHVTGSSSTASGQSIYAPASLEMAFSTNSVERMRIDSNGVIKSVVAGNNAFGGNIQLGITTDDTAKYGAITSTQYDSGTEAEGFYALTTYSASAENRVVIGGGLGEANAANNIIFNTASDQSTRNGTERMRIDTNGNVVLPTDTTDTTKSIRIGSASGDAGWSIGNGLTSAEHLFQVYDNTAGAARLSIDDGGNIHMPSSSAETLIKVDGNSAATKGIRIQSDNAGGIIYATNPSVAALRFGVSENDSTIDEAMQIGASGNVGIGYTSHATSKCYIVGDSGDALLVDNKITGAGGSLILDTQNAGFILFRTESTERMRITEEGNMAIANTDSAPSAPSSGGILYVEAGTLKYIGQGFSSAVTLAEAP